MDNKVIHYRTSNQSTVVTLTVSTKRVIHKTRSSRPEVFCKKGVLRNFAKFLRKHLCQSLFFNKVACFSKTTATLCGSRCFRVHTNRCSHISCKFGSAFKFVFNIAFCIVQVTNNMASHMVCMIHIPISLLKLY